MMSRLSIYLIFLSLIMTVLLPSCGKTEDYEPPEGWQHFLPGFQVMDFIEYDDSLWVGGRDGLRVIDPETGSDAGVPGNRVFSFTSALEIDNAGRLWIGHDNGVTIFHDDTIEELTETDGLVSNHIRSLASDGKGMWIGTTYGADYYRDGEITRYLPEDGLLNENVNALFVDSGGRIWFGSYRAPGGGVSILRDGDWIYFTIENGLPHNNVTSFAEDTNGDIWVGTGLVDRGGAVRLDVGDDQPEIVEKLDATTGLAANKVRSIFIDPSGARWFGSEYNGLTVTTGDRRCILDVGSGLCNNEITTMVMDSSGSMLLGTFNGINVIEASAVEQIYSEMNGDITE